MSACPAVTVPACGLAAESPYGKVFCRGGLAGCTELLRMFLCAAEIGFEEDLMRRLIEGTLGIGLMYTPSHAPGLVVEYLFDERLVLVSSQRDTQWPGEDHIYVEWGPGFYAKHRENYPDLEHPPQVVNIGWLGVQQILANGGSCFLPLRMAQPLIDAGHLFKISSGPEIHPSRLYGVLARGRQ
jgi:DNA-binding transcriptional LysR family regulator